MVASPFFGLVHKDVTVSYFYQRINISIYLDSNNSESKYLTMIQQYLKYNTYCQSYSIQKAKKVQVYTYEIYYIRMGFISNHQEDTLLDKQFLFCEVFRFPFLQSKQVCYYGKEFSVEKSFFICFLCNQTDLKKMKDFLFYILEDVAFRRWIPSRW